VCPNAVSRATSTPCSCTSTAPFPRRWRRASRGLHEALLGFEPGGKSLDEPDGEGGAVLPPPDSTRPRSCARHIRRGTIWASFQYVLGRCSPRYLPIVILAEASHRSRGSGIGYILFGGLLARESPSLGLRALALALAPDGPAAPAALCVSASLSRRLSCGLACRDRVRILEYHREQVTTRPTVRAATVWSRADITWQHPRVSPLWREGGSRPPTRRSPRRGVRGGHAHRTSMAATCSARCTHEVSRRDRVQRLRRGPHRLDPIIRHGFPAHGASVRTVPG